MAFIKVVSAVLLLVAGVSAQQQGGYGGGYGHDEHYAPAHYSYEYAVKDDHTKDIKQHHESREGDKTQGEYSFLEADGTTRTVKYIVDGKSGFVAQVIRSGHAVHAAPAPVKQVALVQPVQHHYVQPVVQHVAAYKPIVVAPVLHQASSYVSGSTFNNGARRAGNYNNAGLFRSNYNNGGFGGYSGAGAGSSYSSFSSGAGYGANRGANSGFGRNY